MTDEKGNGPEAAKDSQVPLAINEVQLLLAEKRTSLSTLRTGIAMLALPLSVLSVLIATSKYYSVMNVLELLIPLTILNLGLIGLAAYLIARALRNIHHQDRMIAMLKMRHQTLAEFLD